MSQYKSCVASKYWISLYYGADTHRIAYDRTNLWPLQQKWRETKATMQENENQTVLRGFATRFVLCSTRLHHFIGLSEEFEIVFISARNVFFLVLKRARFILLSFVCNETHSHIVRQAIPFS